MHNHAEEIASIRGWPRAMTAPLASARIRRSPEDFLVEEQINFPLTGSGEHLWIYVEKRGHNTEHVAKLLARACGVSGSAVRFAGLKDRHAVTRQYFSIQHPQRELVSGDQPAQDVTVIAVTRHTRALKRGAPVANRFTLRLQECRGVPEAVAARLQQIAGAGVPNYFGPQRFGHGGENVERARAMFAGQRIRDRHLRGIYLSAARSQLFNAVLARRIAAGTWETPLAGDVFMLDGKNSFFVADEITPELRARFERHDVHLSGPMWGSGAPLPHGSVAELEQSVIRQHADLADGLAAAGVRQERRALRMIPRALTHRWLDATTLELSFELPGGSYATALTAELIDDEPS